MWWEQVIHEAAAFGPAPLNGSSPLVGVVGYTLGGGRLRHVTAQQEPELFWALRGGKGNFGVVTSIEFDLVPVSRLYGGGLYFPGSAAADVLHTYREWVTGMPEELTSSVALIRFPPQHELPEPLRGRFLVHVRIAFLGSDVDGERLVRPLRRAAPLVLDGLVDMPYTDVARIHDDPTAPLPAALSRTD